MGRHVVPVAWVMTLDVTYGLESCAKGVRRGAFCRIGYRPDAVGDPRSAVRRLRELDGGRGLAIMSRIQVMTTTINSTRE